HTERVRRSLERLKTWLPSMDQSLDQLSLLEKKGQLLIRMEAGLVEPSGQLHFEFDEGHEIIQAEPTGPEECFESGCQLEEEGLLAEAADAYRRALRLGGPDPVVSFNLANVLYALGHKEEASE